MNPLPIKNYLTYPAGAGGNFLCSFFAEGVENLKADGHNEWKVNGPIPFNGQTLFPLNLLDELIQGKEIFKANGWVGEGQEDHNLDGLKDLLEVHRKARLSKSFQKMSDKRIYNGHMLPLEVSKLKLVDIENLYIMNVAFEHRIWVAILCQAKHELKFDFSKTLEYTMSNFAKGDNEYYKAVKFPIRIVADHIDPLLQKHFPLIQIGSIMHAHILRKAAEHPWHGTHNESFIFTQDWIRKTVVYRFYQNIKTAFTDDGSIDFDNIEKKLAGIKKIHMHHAYHDYLDKLAVVRELVGKIHIYDYKDFFYNFKKFKDKKPWSQIPIEKIQSYALDNLKFMSELALMCNVYIDPNNQHNLGRYINGVNRNFYELMENYYYK